MLTPRVLKFGGSSVADAACMRQVAALVRAALPAAPLVVLSAMGKTTDGLVAASQGAQRGDLDRALERMRGLATAHRDAVADLFEGSLLREHAGAVATPGGTGALALAVANFLEPGQALEQALLLSDAPCGHDGGDRGKLALVLGEEGAEAFYSLAVRGPVALGIAIKIADGGERARDGVVLDVLRQLGSLSGEEFTQLSDLYRPEIRNHRGLLVGEVVPDLELVEVS